jgi:hypothetical protein
MTFCGLSDKHENGQITSKYTGGVIAVHTSQGHVRVTLRSTADGTFTAENGRSLRAVGTSALLDGPPVGQLLNNLPAIYGNRRFVTLFTRARHSSLSWGRSVLSYHPIVSSTALALWLLIIRRVPRYHGMARGQVSDGVAGQPSSLRVGCPGFSSWQW